MRFGVKKVFILLWFPVVLVGCSNEDPLRGERISIDVPLEETIDVVSDPDGFTVGEYIDQSNVNSALPIVIPTPQNLVEWTHVNGNRQHNPGNLQLDDSLRTVWQASIGTGNSDKARISTSPIIAEGRIYAMDASKRVRALSLDGNVLWERSLLRVGDDPVDASSGGLAVGEGLLFATTGFGQLYAIEPSSGFVVWVQNFKAPATSGPAVADGKAFLVTMDNKAWAINVGTGRLDWGVQSIESLATVSSDGSPAIASGNVIFGFPSGEVVSVAMSSGGVNWRVFVGGSRGRGAISILTGITASPVIADDRVYISNQSGATVSLNLDTGGRYWDVTEGAFSSALKIDNSVFIISDETKLVRLDVNSGERIWSVALPGFKNEKANRRKAIYSNFGPLMAGGRIVVASSNGQVFFHDPESGQVEMTVAIPGGATASPVIVDGTMYLISASGVLYAYR